MEKILLSFNDTYKIIMDEREKLNADLEKSFRSRKQFSLIEKMKRVLKHAEDDFASIIETFQNDVRETILNFSCKHNHTFLRVAFEDGDFWFDKPFIITAYSYDDDDDTLRDSIDTIDQIMTEVNKEFEIYGVYITLKIVHKATNVTLYTNKTKTEY